MLFREKFWYSIRNHALVILAAWCVPSICLAQNGSWAAKASMTTARFALSASAVDGIIYVIGGNAGTGTGVTTVEAYDPATDSWTTKAAIITQRLTFSTSSLDGKIYAIGGRTTPTGGAISTIEIYDPESDVWTAKADMPTARVLLGTSAVNGKIYAIGGASFSDGLVFSTVEEYDPGTDAWSTKASMSVPRHSFETGVVNGKIYAVGGDATSGGGGETVSVEEYDPATDAWASKADLPSPRSAFSLSVADGKLYVISGSEAVFPHAPLTKEVLEYDPVTDVWTAREPIPTERAFFATGVVNGKIYAIGGSPTAFPFTTSASVEEYTPPTATGVEDVLEGVLPETFTLHQNYPNPFNPATTIAFHLANPGFVTLKIFDLSGRELAVLASRRLESGAHKVRWSAAGLSSGVYFYQLRVSANRRVVFTETRKLSLLK